MEDQFPRHLSLHIQHNEHKGYYQSAAEWAAENDERQYAQWATDDERAKAIAEDSIWTVQWYPDTPVGFHCVAASTLAAAVACTVEITGIMAQTPQGSVSDLGGL